MSIIPKATHYAEFFQWTYQISSVCTKSAFSRFFFLFPHPQLYLDLCRLSAGMCSSHNDGLCVWRVKTAGERGNCCSCTLHSWARRPGRCFLRLPGSEARPQQWLLPARLCVLGKFQTNRVSFWEERTLCAKSVGRVWWLVNYPEE